VSDNHTMRDTDLRRACAIAVVTACAACGHGSAPVSPSASAEGSAFLTPVLSSAEWPSASPASANLDADRLARLAGLIRSGAFGTVTSLLMARNGQLVVEEYFNGWSAAVPHTMQSVSKSVTSLIAGIAIDQGRLRLDDQAVAIMRRYAPFANPDPRKDAITVHDLLTMRDGFDWNEDFYAGSPLQRLNDCRCDWLRFVLDWPMREPPGTRWQYVSGGAILLAGMIGEATGQRMDRFADQFLFAPLETQNAWWIGGLPNGLPHAGGGLNLRPRDMAKIGQLVLDDGRWRGRQIVSADWISASTARRVGGVRSFGSHSVDYGFLWWTMNPSEIVTASGAMGQWLFVSVRDRLVVAVTSRNDDARWALPADFLYTEILPAVR
jgi:CubicO group peptidase (beta-lactamase class C family)